MTKLETYAPKVSTQALIISCLMDAKEGRYVATIEIPDVFMHAYMKYEVNMKLDRTMADLFSKIDPQLYEQYVIIENGKKVLYAIIKKSLYGTVQNALLIYHKMTRKIKEWGFELSPYDTCIENNTVDGKQFTILWHVDDLNIYHFDSKVVDSIINIFDEEFGIYAPLIFS